METAGGRCYCSKKSNLTWLLKEAESLHSLYAEAPLSESATLPAEMKMDLDLNPADFQLYDGFGFYKFCLTGFGFDNLVLSFFATFSFVSEL